VVNSTPVQFETGAPVESAKRRLGRVKRRVGDVLRPLNWIPKALCQVPVARLCHFISSTGSAWDSRWSGRTFPLESCTLPVRRGFLSFSSRLDQLTGAGEQRLQAGHRPCTRGLTPDRPGLKSSTRLLISMIRRKRFLWTFLALEIMVRKLSKHLLPRVVGRFRLEGEAQIPPELLATLISEHGRQSLAAQFVLMSLGLSPATAEEDLVAFRLIKKARDRLSHGDVRSEEELPLAEADSLLQRYFSLAMSSDLSREA